MKGLRAECPAINNCETVTCTGANDETCWIAAAGYYVEADGYTVSGVSYVRSYVNLLF